MTIALSLGKLILLPEGSFKKGNEIVVYQANLVNS